MGENRMRQQGLGLRSSENKQLFRIQPQDRAYTPMGLGSAKSQAMRASSLAASASSRVSISRLKAPGTRLEVTEMTPVAPWLCRATCASSSLPLQQATPREV